MFTAFARCFASQQYLVLLFTCASFMQPHHPYRRQSVSTMPTIPEAPPPGAAATLGAQPQGQSAATQGMCGVGGGGRMFGGGHVG